ncbi:PRC-barrel domain-containing protein [Rhizorhabdus argentea]|uniref:PRC-barrel domain-containing protein n=1 Tax=Rhizorhabdus argentea TaxID=1387174 RepID=UPI0030EE9ABE
MDEPIPEAGPDSSQRLILSSRVEGAAVFNESGETIGHVDDLSIERLSGRVIYAIMSFGGFLGIGEKFHPIPWSMLDYDPTRGGYVVPLDRAALQGAPHYGRDELVSLGGPSHRGYEEQIFQYYGAYGPLPYW